MWTEIVFNLAYLVTVWWLVITMTYRRSAVAPDDREPARLVRWAFFLLALGDTGHVGFRVLAYALGDLGIGFTLVGQRIGLVGLGALSTAFTLTLFYVIMLFLWRARLQGELGWFGSALLVAGLIRLCLLVPPSNQWNSVVPPQPWSIYRNLPLMFQGLGVAHLILRDAYAKREWRFVWIGILILVSFGCYVPVVLFVQTAPLLGMLMIPKTISYVAIGFLAFRDLYIAEDERAATSAVTTAL
jgi:hypothetical protein